jgi:hypothetical protein
MVMNVRDSNSSFERAVGAPVVWPVDNRHGWRLGGSSNPAETTGKSASLAKSLPLARRSRSATLADYSIRSKPRDRRRQAPVTPDILRRAE